MRVSLNLYDPDGAVVRELLQAAPRSAGPNVAIWDGLDRDGVAVAAGQYSWKLLATHGLQAEFLMAPGSNYPTGPEWWQVGPGTHGNPAHVEFDGTGMYVAASFTEGLETSLLKQSLDGSQRLWTRGWPELGSGTMDLAVDGGVVYVLASGAVPARHGRVWRYDAATGESIGDPYTISIPPLEVFAAGIAVRGNLLAAIYPEEDAVAWFRPDDGHHHGTVPGLSELRDVQFDGAGTTWLALGDRIVRIPSGSTTPVDFITGLETPSALAIDDASGEVLVAETGTSQQILRFDNQGNLLARYGRPGGRRPSAAWTLEERESYWDLNDIEFDDQGGHYIAGELWLAPRRVAHFSRQGEILDEWYGGQTWAPFVAPDPTEPTVLYMASEWGSVIRARLDFQNRDWQVEAVFQFGNLADGLIPKQFSADTWEVRYHNGIPHLVKMVGEPIVLRIDEQNWQLIPLVVGATHIKHNMDNQAPIIQQNAGPNDDAFLWTDQDGDGWPQVAEIEFFTSGGPWHGPSAVAADFSYIFAYNWWPNEQILAHPVVGWNSVGAPIYAHFPDGIEVAEPSPRKAIAGWYGPFLWRDPNSGELWGGYNHRAKSWGHAKDAFVVRWNADGTAAWTAGQGVDTGVHGTAPPGSIGAIRGVCGAVDETIFFTDYDGGWGGYPPPTYGWDRDGLWVGGLFESIDLSADLPVWRYNLCGENLDGQILKVPGTEEVLYFGHMENEARVYRISGFQAWERQSGSVIVTAPSTQLGTGLRAEYFEDSELQKKTGARLDSMIQFDWGSGAPAGTGISLNDGWSVRWTGEIMAVFSEPYTFHLDADGGVRLIVDGEVLIDDWQDSSSVQRRSGSPSKDWLAGRRYSIQLEFLDAAGDASCALSWESGGRPEQIVPSGVLFGQEAFPLPPAGHGGGLQLQVFDGPDFSGAPLHQQEDALAEIQWGSNLPPPFQMGGTYSARWQGRWMPRQSGMHRIKIESDWPAVQTQLWLNGKALFQQGGLYELVELRSGVAYDLKMEAVITLQPGGFLRLLISPPRSPALEGYQSLQASQLSPDFQDNALPDVFLLEPKHDTLVVAGSSINLEVETADFDGQVQEVQFLSNGQIAATLNSPPWVTQIPAPSAGIYRIQAVAVDDRGQTSPSRISTVIAQ